MKSFLKRTPLIALILAGAVSMPVIGQATVIGFGQLGGNNVTVPATLGSNASAGGSGYVVNNGATPNIALNWDSVWDIHTSSFFAALENRTAGGGAWDNEGSIPRVGQLDATRHTITFTTNPGYALILNSFDFCHSNESVGQKTEWDITLTDSTANVVWGTHLVLDNTGNTNASAAFVTTVSPNFTGTSGGTYTLTFNQTFTSYGSTANGRHAIDNLSFNQIAVADPGPEILDPATPKADVVDVMFGVAGGANTGSTVPGPCLPQSSIYPSPNTVAAAAGGYSAGSDTIGFAQLHATGSGSSTMSFGNFLVSPRLGANTSTLEDDNGSPISNVVARPYSYRGRLVTPGIDCTVVPTANCAIYQFDFPASTDARIYFDVARKLNSSTGMTSGSTTVDLANGTISGGGTFDGNWNPAAYNVYFYAKLDTAPASGGTWLGNTPTDGVLTRSTATRQRIGSWVRFDTGTNRTVRMKIGVSFQSVAKAQQYVEGEIPAWDLAGLEATAKTSWNDTLGTVQAPGISKAEARKLYTALFHSLIQPRNRTGDPTGWPSDAPFWDDQYTPWDTWQTLYPLLGIVKPSSVAAIVNSFGERYARNGRAETAFIQGKDFQVGQGGDEVDRVIADAYVKGIPGIDWTKIWPLLQFHAGRRTADYRNLGFVSIGNRDGYDSRMASGSSTIAFAHGDWCAAQVGASLGHTTEAQALLTRSENWRNVWDATLAGDGFTGFVRGKNSNGTFSTTAATAGSGTDFYQGTCWNYSFNIHDRPAMMNLMGGRARFIQRLEFAFDKGSTSYLDFGNEVNLQAVPLLARAQRPGAGAYWAENVRLRYGILSYPGDEDSGAMASLYFFLTAGFIPAATEGTYYLHGPRVPQLEFNVGGGNKFTVTATNAGGANLYVQSATLDGQPLHTPVIHHADITAGKTLAFVMGPNPTAWGTGEDFSAPARRDLETPVNAGWTAALGSPQITGAASDSPVWGAGSNGADNTAIYSAFPEVSLTQAGSSVTLVATVTLNGMATTQTAPNARFAWGVFNANGQSGATGWLGYLAGNDTIDATGKESIWRKGAGNSTEFHSATSATTLTSYALPAPAFADGTYRLVMTLTRTATGALDYYAALVRSSDGVLFAAFTGSDLTPPTYSFNRVGLRSGNVLDTDSVQVSQATVIANGTGLLPPTVALTAPAAGTNFTAPADITLSADATDSDGTVAKVEFYANGTKVGEDLAAPFTVVWNATAAGSYALTALATDNDGGTTTSAAINVNVQASSIASSENFDSMGASGTAMPAGWSMKKGEGGGNSTWSTSITPNGATLSVASMIATTSPLTVNNSPTANNINGYNAQRPGGSSTQRVIATAPTTVTGGAIQWQLTNNTANAIPAISLGYDIIRFTAVAAGDEEELPGYQVFYSLNNGTTWTNVAALNPTLSGTSGVIVPNSTGFTTVPPTTINLSGNWNTGTDLLLRWVDDNAVDPSPDQILGLDNVTIATPQPAPTVAITTPTSGASIALPGPVNIAATAADENGSVTKVEFFQGATKLGEDIEAPFTFAWSGMISGTYSLTARATDNQAATTTSAAVNITVTNPNNVAPSVAITSPLNGATVPASTITIEATAADTDGVVSKVEFFVGTTKLGEDTSAPFTYNWTTVPVGTHALTAVATDNDGGVTTSAAVTIQAVAFTDLTSIARGATWKYFDQGTDLGTAWKEPAFDDSAWASGPAKLGYQDGRVTVLQEGPSGQTSTTKFITYYFRRTFTITNASQVFALKTNLLRDDGAVIYLNGVEVGRSNMPAGAVNYLTESDTIVSGADETTYYLLNLPTAALVNGTNVLAVSIHQRDNTSSDLGFDLDLITTVQGGNALPNVQITSPLANANFSTGADIPIIATASDSDGTVTKVEFYAGATKLGEDTSDPYEFTWQTVPAGNYSLTAVATDDFGSTRTSAAVPVTVTAGPSGTLVRGPYLNQANQNSIVVRWRSSQSIVGRVRYGTAPGSLTQFSDEAAPTTNHEVKLTGLTPYTRYYYSVGSASDTLTPEVVDTTTVRTTAFTIPAPTAADYTFRTSPVPGTATNTRIWVVGDCGRGSATQAAGRDAYYNWMGSRVPDFNLQLGDNAYNAGTDAEYQTGYFLMYPTIFRKMVQWSTLGNHDANNGNTDPTQNWPYFDMFTFPKNAECGGAVSGTEHYYSFDYGNVHVISLDSQTTLASRSANAPQTLWLQNDLASTTKTWIIVIYHHPSYSKGSHNSDTEGQMVLMREVYNPIMEAGGVDLVLTGHSHNYERSVLIDGHYGVSSTLIPAMKKNAGNGSTTGFTINHTTAGDSGKIRRASNGFVATATVNGTVVPPDGAYIKPLTGPRDHFGTVYNTAGSSGQADGGGIDHPVMYISYDTVGTVNLDISGNTLVATYIQADGNTPDNYTIIKQGAADSDGDGMSDEYEIANGLNRLSAADAALDSDGDGLSNLDESRAGTSASNATDKPRVASLAAQPDGSILLQVATVAGKTYRLEANNGFPSGNWTLVADNIAGTGGLVAVPDPGAAGIPNRIYRVTVLP